MRRSIGGLEIGHRGFRAVGISGGSTARISAVGAAAVGEVLDSDGVAEAITQVWTRTGLRKDVVLGLSGRHVIVRQVELPWMEKKAFRKALPFRNSGQLPVPVEEDTTKDISLTVSGNMFVLDTTGIAVPGSAPSSAPTASAGTK